MTKRICIGQEKNTKVHRFVQRIRVYVRIWAANSIDTDVGAGL